MTENVDMMKDRHLDQLLMCSLYICFKVAGQNITFTDIMKHYRNQPQAASHVYRSVLLKKTASTKNDDGSADTEKPKESVKAGPPPTPTKPAASSSVVDGEERGDLITFYNEVFMQRLKEYSLKFKRSNAQDAPPLSPLPKLRAHPQSPCRKISDSHHIYIRPLKTAASNSKDSSSGVTFNPTSPHKPISYSFSRSPAKDLKRINELMKSQERPRIGKRLLTNENDEPNNIHQTAPQQVTAFINEHGDLVTAEAAAAPVADQQQLIIIQGDLPEGVEQPPMKMQVIEGGQQQQAQIANAVNQKLELILGDRSGNDVPS